MMKSRAFVVVILCLYTLICQAQNESEIKNIQKRLDESQDSTKIKLLSALYDSFFYSNLDKALEYAQKGYDIAMSNGSEPEIAEFSYKIGNVYLLQSKYSSALIYFLKTINLAEDINNTSLLAKSYSKVGSTYFDQENYPKALEYFFKYMQVQGNQGDKSELASTFRNIGKVYERQGIYRKAIDYHYQSLELYKYLNDFKEVSNELASIANIYAIQTKYPNALKYLFKSVEISKNIKDTVQIVSQLNSIGGVYEKQGNYYEALTNFFEALKLVESIGDKTGIALCLHNISKIYFFIGETDNALDYELESYTVAKEIRSKEYIRITSLGLSNIFGSIKNYKKAFEFHQVYSNYKDSLLNEKSKTQIAESNINYEAEKREKEIELLRREQLLLKQRNEIQNLNLSKRNLLIYTLIVIIFLVFVLVIALYNRILLKKKINEELEKKVKERTSSLELAVNELFKTNNELDNFIYRSSHDLSGPLATLSGLCNVALLDVKDSTSLVYFNRLKEVINRMSNLLYLIIDIGNIKHHTIEKSVVHLKSFIEKIISDIGYEEKLKNIDVKIEILENSKVETDSKMLEVAICNIIKNAIQYSIPPKSNHNPYIKIGFKEMNNYWEIYFADNGNGIPPEFSEKIFDMFFKATNQSSGFGLGLYKAKNAIEKLGGEIYLYNSSNNHKTVFIISIPKKPKYPKPYFFFDFNFRNLKSKASAFTSMQEHSFHEKVN